MELETDADRRGMLLALGGSEDITVEGRKLSAALFTAEPRVIGFDSITVNTESPALQCCMSEAREMGLTRGQTVVIPGLPDEYVIASGPVNESGMAFMELRKA